MSETWTREHEHNEHDELLIADLAEECGLSHEQAVTVYDSTFLRALFDFGVSQGIAKGMETGLKLATVLGSLGQVEVDGEPAGAAAFLARMTGAAEPEPEPDTAPAAPGLYL